jgi:hypothetical protein
MANGNEIEKNTNCSIGTIMDKISMLARVSNLTISQKIKESDTKQRFRIEAGESRDGVVTFINPRVGDRLIRQDKANPADLSVEVEVYRDSLNQTVISYKNPSKLKSPNYNAYINAKIDRLDRELCKITSMALAQTCVGFKSEF